MYDRTQAWIDASDIFLEIQPRSSTYADAVIRLEVAQWDSGTSIICFVLSAYQITGMMLDVERAFVACVTLRPGRTTQATRHDDQPIHHPFEPHRL
jgi:hypothetical protein